MAGLVYPTEQGHSQFKNGSGDRSLHGCAGLGYREHTTGARFFINTAYWLNNAYRSVDGGGWLLPYTGRWSLVPTIFYSYSPDKDEVVQIREWGERASQITTCSEDFWALVDEADLGWIYIRAGVGELQPESLTNCEGITDSYTNNSVYIYIIER